MQIRHILIKITFKSSPLKPLNQIKPNLAGMVPGWVPFKIVSNSPAPHSRWLLLLKIETISSYFDKGSHCFFKPLNQITLNLAGMVLGWVPFNIVSDSPTFYSRWLLLLKIEISSIVHCCFSRGLKIP